MSELNSDIHELLDEGFKPNYQNVDPLKVSDDQLSGKSKESELIRYISCINEDQVLQMKQMAKQIESKIKERDEIQMQQEKLLNQQLKDKNKGQRKELISQLKQEL